MDEKTDRKLTTSASVVAGTCLLVLALVHVFGLSRTEIDLALIGGLVAAGTVVWVVQAQRKCRKCGTAYGYRVRLLRSHVCRKCGADLRQG